MAQDSAATAAFEAYKQSDDETVREHIETALDELGYDVVVPDPEPELQEQGDVPDEIVYAPMSEFTARDHDDQTSEDVGLAEYRKLGSEIGWCTVALNRGGEQEIKQRKGTSTTAEGTEKYETIVDTLDGQFDY